MQCKQANDIYIYTIYLQNNYLSKFNARKKECTTTKRIKQKILKKQESIKTSPGH